MSTQTNTIVGNVPNSIKECVGRVDALLESKIESLKLLFSEADHLTLMRLEGEAIKEGFFIQWVLAIGPDESGESQIRVHAEARSIPKEYRELLRIAADLDIAELDKIEGSSK